MTLPAAELARLRAGAERAMREDAEPADAAARERLLQLYRDCILDRGHFDLSGTLGRGDPCGEEDIGGLEWIARLAAAGHMPAAALLERVLDERRFAELTAAAPERMAALTPLVPTLARREAFRALHRGDTDYERIARLLTSGGTLSALIADILRALVEHAGAPGEEERKLLARAVVVGYVTNANAACELMTAFGTRRLISADAGERAAGERLIACAAELDPPNAAVLEWILRVHAKAPEFMRAWLAEHPDPFEARKLARLSAGVAFETGRATGMPDLPEATRWYAFAIDGTPRSGGEAGAGNPKLCYAVAKQIEIQLLRENPDLQTIVRAWYERGAKLGEKRCVAALASGQGGRQAGRA